MELLHNDRRKGGPELVLKIFILYIYLGQKIFIPKPPNSPLPLFDYTISFL